MVPIFSSLIVALSLADAASPDRAVIAAGADASTMSLDVPYVPQTEALCGGAAVAMVFRYWGEAHAGVQEFASLVDRRAHGIVTDVLVHAIEQRKWRVNESAGSIDTLRADVAGGHPPIILIEDRPHRYHYVVVVGAGSDHVIVHDPAWGPSRRLGASDLMRRWAPTGFWSAVILPGRQLDRNAEPTYGEPDVHVNADTAYSRCEELLSDAIEEVRQEGLAHADEILGSVRARCPGSAGPLRELAGVRFAERQWRAAAALAETAVGIDPSDEYAWDVLGSSRFMQDDPVGALRAWNEIGKPRIDAVRIEGLTRTRYALLADTLRLPTGGLLTPDRFRRAQRRLEELPGTSSARLGLRPQSDGFAGIDVALVEPPATPHGATAWAARGTQAAVEREIAVAIPGTTGQGEQWSAAWRWWSNRPRVRVAFAAPRTGMLPGVWRVEASWERQTYTLDPHVASVQEDRTHGGLSISDWLTANRRYELTAGIDSWNNTRRAVSFGGALEQRALGDRLSIVAAATTWMPLTTNSRFDALAAGATFRSSTAATGTIGVIDGGIEAVSSGAPMTLWVGAGDGHARAPLLRAHPLLAGGIISGPIFGRQLAYGNGEVQRWIRLSPAGVAIAAFVDVARASSRARSAVGDPFQIDAGAGVRVRVPGQKGTFRVDFGRGVRDGAHALTVGWQP